MSQYLTIRKDGVVIGSWSRSTDMYIAFPWAEYEQKTFDPKKIFPDAKEYLNNMIASYERNIKVNEEILKGNLDFEDRYNMVCAVIEAKEEIEAANRFKNQIDFMLEAYYYDEYTCNDGAKHNVWTYVIE